MQDYQRASMLCDHAWSARVQANPRKNGTKVGCAIYTSTKRIVTGYNIEGLWATSIHAEVNAISKLHRDEKILAIAIVAETAQFTPCGACLDWIVQFSDAGVTRVIIDNGLRRWTYSVAELVPHYPTHYPKR